MPASIFGSKLKFLSKIEAKNIEINEYHGKNILNFVKKSINKEVKKKKEPSCRPWAHPNSGLMRSDLSIPANCLLLIAILAVSFTLVVGSIVISSDRIVLISVQSTNKYMLTNMFESNRNTLNFITLTFWEWDEGFAHSISASSIDNLR